MSGIKERIAEIRKGFQSLNLFGANATPAQMANAVRSEFKERAGDPKTLRKVFSNDDAQIATVTDTILTKLETCIAVSNLHYRAYRAHCEALDINSSAEDLAASLAGDYVFYRLDIEQNITRGGMRLVSEYGLNRFYHFNRFDDFDGYRTALANHDPSHGQRPPMPYNHKGYYFHQGGRMIMIGMDTTYYRSIMGNWETPDGLRHRPLSLMVLARAQSGGVFAAKSLMYSEHHPFFSTPPTEATIRQELKANDSPAIIQFTE